MHVSLTIVASTVYCTSTHIAPYLVYLSFLKPRQFGRHILIQLCHGQAIINLLKLVLYIVIQIKKDTGYLKKRMTVLCPEDWELQAYLQKKKNIDQKNISIHSYVCCISLSNQHRQPFPGVGVRTEERVGVGEVVTIACLLDCMLCYLVWAGSQEIDFLSFCPAPVKCCLSSSHYSPVSPTYCNNC